MYKLQKGITEAIIGIVIGILLITIIDSDRIRLKQYKR